MAERSTSRPERDSVALFVVAFVASATVGTHGLVYWDAGDYTRLALEGGHSGLLLGRPLFLAVSRALLRLVDPERAEPALRWAWTAFSACAAPLLTSLAREVGLGRREAFFSGLALALSPAFAHTAHQVLTDDPAVVLTLLALLLSTRQRGIVAGLVLGAAIATRETAVLLAPSLLLLLRERRERVLASISIVLGTAGIVLGAHQGLPPSLVGWTRAMHRSSTLHLSDVLVSLGWLVSIGPFVLFVGARAVREASRELRLVALPAALGTALLILYPFGAYSPRYVLATAPLAFLLPAGILLARRPRLALAALLLPLPFVVVATSKTRAVTERGELAARELSAATPMRALIVPGHYCPQLRLHFAIEAKKTGRARDVTYLCPGWEWPADAAKALETARCEGRTLVVDLRDDAWLGKGELEPAAAIKAWARVLAGPIAVVPPRTCD